MKDEYRAVGSWGTLGLEIVLGVMVGFLGGRWLDAKLGSDPWLGVAGFLLGCGAAGKSVHRTWKEMQAVTAREEREQGNPRPAYERPVDREDSGDKGSVEEPAAPSSPDDDGRPA